MAIFSFTVMWPKMPELFEIHKKAGRDVRGMGRKEPAISVIIPMYNEEKYIAFCMESIIKQTFRDYEVLLLDDASTDGTYALCQKLYASLPNVTLIGGEKNVGRGAIRNKGIELARGKYIYFMDSDDELLPKALDKFYAKAEETKADVVHANYYMKVFTDEKMLPRQSLWKECRCGDCTEGLLAGNKEERMMYQGQGSQPMPWLNLYRRDFLLASGIRFPSLPYGEDNIFSVEVAMTAERFVRFGERLNLYRLSFAKKEREKKRLDSAFAVIPVFLAEWNRIFDKCSEDELSFSARMTFTKSWLRAHLRYTVYDVINTCEKAAFQSVKEYLHPIMSGGDFLGALLINMIEVDTWERKLINDQATQKREGVMAKFEELDRDTSKHQLDAAYIYSEAKQASQIEGGEDGYYSKAYLYMARASLVLGRSAEAWKCYDKAVEKAQKDREQAGRLAAEKMAALSLVDGSGESMRQEYQRIKHLLAPQTPYRHNRRSTRKKIRLGVLADAFCRHELFAVLFGLLFCYNKENLAVYCYHMGRKDDDFTEAIHSSVDGFASVAELSGKDVADMIYDDGIDVLMDFSGRSMVSALPIMACHPAPLQIGGPARLPLRDTGLFDYCITDEVTNQGLAKAGNVWTLPCAYSYAMRDDVIPSAQAPVMAKGCITLGVAAHYYQISDEMLLLWKEIMIKVPQARILLMVEEFADKAMQVEAKERMGALGFEMERVEFESTVGDSLPKYLSMDILLGTFPSIPGGKFLDALYMGVPIITLYGKRPDTRLGLSMLKVLGLEDLATDSKEGYVAKAVELAGDRAILNSLHKNLRGMMESTRAFNPVGWMRGLEKKIELAYVRSSINVSNVLSLLW